MLNISLSNEELQALTKLIDAGVRGLGLDGVKPAAIIIDKLEKAVAQANAPKQETSDGE
jgi:hypothetical protein